MKNENESPQSFDALEKLAHYSELFDCYEPLFTDKQKTYFKDYYFYDLSLSEIAKNYNISRSAVYDTISKMHIALDEYEDKLSLSKQKKKLDDLLDKYEAKANKDNNELLLKLIEELRKCN